jgi:hypothetical protein
LNDRLQTFGVEPSDAAEDFVEEAGFGCSQESSAGCQNHFFLLKYQYVANVETRVIAAAAM